MHLPDVELPDIAGIDCGHEVHRTDQLTSAEATVCTEARHLVRYVHNVLVRADAIESSGRGAIAFESDAEVRWHRKVGRTYGGIM